MSRRKNQVSTDAATVETVATDAATDAPRKGRKVLAIEDRKHVLPVANLSVVARLREHLLASIPPMPERPEMPEFSDDDTGATIRESMTAYARSLAVYPDAVAAWERENSEILAFVAICDAARPASQIKSDAAEDAAEDAA